MPSKTHSNGWISVNISESHEDKAKEMRARRDCLYGNIFQEESSDLRWSGDLGEYAFKSWLNHEGVSDYNWLTGDNDATGNADFEIGKDVLIGVKTVKRKKAPKIGYTAQITASHINEPVSHFFFLTYVYTMKEMWLLGAIHKDKFAEQAKFYGEGEQVHPHYTVREKHGILNIDTRFLTSPSRWLLEMNLK